MTTFDDRQKAYEDKFAHDEELRFKATVRAAKIFGKWVVEKASFDASYPAVLVNLITAGKTEAQLVKKVQEDLSDKGQGMDAEVLSERFQACVNQAKEELAKA